MIIDLILDRKHDDELLAQGYTHCKAWNGEILPLAYNAGRFYRDVMSYNYLSDSADDITRAMDFGTEDDVRQALCQYIIRGGYNPDICNYINSAAWLQ